MSLWCCMSTVRPKCLRKSAPKMGFWTSAMMKIHGSDRLRPRLRVRDRFPYVRIGVSLTAMSVSGSGEHRRSVWVGGIARISEPVSTNNRVLVGASLT